MIYLYGAAPITQTKHVYIYKCKVWYSILWWLQNIFCVLNINHNIALECKVKFLTCCQFLFFCLQKFVDCVVTHFCNFIILQFIYKFVYIFFDDVVFVLILCFIIVITCSSIMRSRTNFYFSVLYYFGSTFFWMFWCFLHIDYKLYFIHKIKGQVSQNRLMNTNRWLCLFYCYKDLIDLNNNNNPGMIKYTNSHSVWI